MLPHSRFVKGTRNKVFWVMAFVIALLVDVVTIAAIAIAVILLVIKYIGAC
jgi:hypothetical protein